LEPSPGSTGRPSDWKWWADADVRQQLRLTDNQVGRLQALFDRRAIESTPFLELLRLQREKLDSMTRERTADRATYAAQVSYVLGLQSRIQEGRIVMLYEMSLELQPEQYKRLQGLLQRNSESSRGRSSVPGRP
jgi:Spy/CpxP family protein refolding chaperone